MSALFDDFDGTTNGDAVGHPMRGALEAILARDPSGWEHRQPTPADQDAHRDWAIETYGPNVWHTYNHVSWGSWGTNPV